MSNKDISTILIQVKDTVVIFLNVDTGSVTRMNEDWSWFKIDAVTSCAFSAIDRYFPLRRDVISSLSYAATIVTHLNKARSEGLPVPVPTVAISYLPVDPRTYITEEKTQERIKLLEGRSRSGDFIREIWLA